jgi:CarD family transcriptional regulator
MVDERYMKQAERLLHGELSAALGIPFEEVPDYIAKRVTEAK